MPLHHIDHYQFGKIIIDGVTYTRDVIILPAGVLPNWWRSEGHRLVTADLERVLEAKPDFLVIGQGASSRMRVAAEVEQVLEIAGIGWVALSTGEACQLYNHRASEKGIAAALHLTC